MLRRIRSTQTGRDYMHRFYLWGAPSMPDGSSPFGEFGGVLPAATRTKGTQAFVHKIVDSDDRSALHNHPWEWACSLILFGGYNEDRYFADLGDAIFYRNNIRHGGALTRYGA